MTEPVLPAPLLKVNDVCALLGVTSSWVYDQIEAGAFPVIVLGRRSYRFKTEDVQAFIDSKYQGGSPAVPTTRKKK